MVEVSIRELRNQGGKVVERVERGERVIVTRNGRPVAELRPLPRKPVHLDVLLEEARRLPEIDPEQLKADLDAIIDPRL